MATEGLVGVTPCMPSLTELVSDEVVEGSVEETGVLGMVAPNKSW